MTNDTTTLHGALAELGETMADNLVTKGVTSADPSDGLTTLAGKILNVPGGGGLDLDTSISLSANSISIIEGTPITLTSVLSATYDDESQANVDLDGVLVGATVLFKDGATTIGTGYTDSYGVATATVSNLSAGTHTIKAVFEGTNLWDNCESSTITVTVTAAYDISLTSTPSILSYADGDVATLTATLTSGGNPVSGKPIAFYHDIKEDSLTSDLGHFTVAWGNISYSNDGVTFGTGTNVAYYNDYSFDFDNKKYRIEMDCTKTGDTYLFANISETGSGSDSSITMQIHTTGIAFCEGSASCPSGLGDTIHVVMEFTPNAQRLYINGELIINSSPHVISSTQYHYLNFYKRNADSPFTIKNLGISEIIDVDETDSNGEATITYTSQGAGDVPFIASYGTFVSASYTIEDCTRYDTTEYTTRQDVQWAMPTGDFEVSADFYHTSNNTSYPQLYIGTELNVNNIAYGKIYGSKYGAEFKKNNARLTMLETNADLSNDTYHTTKLTRVGDLYTVICDNGETLTYSNNTILPTYLFIIYVPQSKIKNIKIKPL